MARIIVRNACGGALLLEQDINLEDTNLGELRDMISTQNGYDEGTAAAFTLLLGDKAIYKSNYEKLNNILSEAETTELSLIKLPPISATALRASKGSNLNNPDLLKEATDKSNRGWILTRTNLHDLLLHVAKELRTDREFLLDLLEVSPYALSYIETSIKEDKTFILNAIERNYRVFFETSEKMQSEKEYICKLLQTKPEAYEIHSRIISSSDQEVADLAIRGDFHNIKNLQEPLRSDEAMSLIALQVNYKALEAGIIAEKWRTDRGFLLKAIRCDRRALKYAPDEFRSDKEFLLEAMQESRSVLKYAADEVKTDKAFMIAAVQRSIVAYNYASDEVKADQDFMEAYGLARKEQKGSFTPTYDSQTAASSSAAAVPTPAECSEQKQVLSSKVAL